MRFFIWEHYKQPLSNQDAQFKESQEQQRNKQKAAFINSKNIINALILRKRAVYSPRPSREAPTDVFYGDTVHFWSTHLLQNLHGLLRIVTLLADHVNWREKSRETGGLITFDWLKSGTSRWIFKNRDRVKSRLNLSHWLKNVTKIMFWMLISVKRASCTGWPYLFWKRPHIATPLQPVSSCPK